ncbi:hypothetical protein [uncultured Paenibacillus sp.]
MPTFSSGSSSVRKWSYRIIRSRSRRF